MNGKRGSATVELAILLPLYALVILGALYFGYGWLIHQESHEEASAGLSMFDQVDEVEAKGSKQDPSS